MGAPKKTAIPLSPEQVEEARQVLQRWSAFLEMFRETEKLLADTRRSGRRLRRSPEHEVVDAAVRGEHIVSAQLDRILATVLDLVRGRPDVGERMNMLTRDLSIMYAVDSLERLLGAGSPALRRAMNSHDLKSVVAAANLIRKIGSIDGARVTLAELRGKLTEPPSPPKGRRGGRRLVAIQILEDLVEMPSATQIERIVRRHSRRLSRTQFVLSAGASARG